MKKFIFIFSVVIFLVLSGCAQQTVCNKPYIQVGSECCLDKDDSKICDKDESAQEIKQEEVKTISPEEALSSVVMFICKGYKDQYDIYGNGFYISENEIITNHHVLWDWAEGCDSYKRFIRKKNEREIAQVELINGEDKTNIDYIGYNYENDLSLLKTNSNSPTHLSFGSSSSLKIGDKVYAVGSPEGLEFSVTSGVISAKGRSGLRDEDTKTYLQIDVPINRGNSGGPLLNEQGLVVGMPTWGYASWYAQNLNFALESDKAKELVDNIKYTYEKTNNGVMDSVIQNYPNNKVKIQASQGFNIEWKMDAKGEVVEKFMFRGVNVNIENNDDKPHNICFSFKIIKNGEEIENKKKLDATVSVDKEKLPTFNVPINIIKEERGTYYFEFNAFDCETNDIYNTASMITTKMTSNFDTFYKYKG